MKIKSNSGSAQNPPPLLLAIWKRFGNEIDAVVRDGVRWLEGAGAHVASMVDWLRAVAGAGLNGYGESPEARI